MAACPRCHGNRFFRVAAMVGEPGFGDVVPCECVLRERAMRQAQELTERSGLIDASQTFATFNSHVAGIDAVREMVRGLMRQQIKMAHLWSPTKGNGKSHILSAIAHWGLGHGRGVAVYNWYKLLEELTAMSMGELVDRQEYLMKVPILLIDEMRADLTRKQAQKLHVIIDARYHFALDGGWGITLVTSNRSSAELVVDSRGLADRDINQSPDWFGLYDSRIHHPRVAADVQNMAANYRVTDVGAFDASNVAPAP